MIAKILKYIFPKPSNTKMEPEGRTETIFRPDGNVYLTITKQGNRIVLAAPRWQGLKVSLDEKIVPSMVLAFKKLGYDTETEGM